MSSMNKVILLGRLGKTPELKSTQSGKAVCNFSLATSEKRGETEATTWHEIVCWEKQAELAAKYLAKGSQVLVEGRIQIREYEAKDGAKKKAFEIVADRVTFVGSKKTDGVSPTPSMSEPEDVAVPF